MNGDDAMTPGGAGVVESHRPAGDEDFAGVGGEDAAQEVDEGALAGTVLADEGVNAAGAEGERGVFQGADAGEGFAEVFQPHRVRHRWSEEENHEKHERHERSCRERLRLRQRAGTGGGLSLSRSLGPAGSECGEPGA